MATYPQTIQTSRVPYFRVPAMRLPRTIPGLTCSETIRLFRRKSDKPYCLLDTSSNSNRLRSRGRQSPRRTGRSPPSRKTSRNGHTGCRIAFRLAGSYG